MNIIKTCSVSMSFILLTSCGTSGREVEKKSNGEFQADHGPFDSKGNYIESWADNPPKRTYKKSSSGSGSSSTRKTTPTPSPSKSTSKPSTSKPSTSKRPTSKPTTSKPTPKPSIKPSPKPSSQPKKFTPKTKPPVMHTVQKGDTVYGIARKYGADPNAIIKVNNIKSGVIRTGQRLVVPRK